MYEKLYQLPEYYTILPEKKYFSPEFGGHVPSLPPPPTPMSEIVGDPFPLTGPSIPPGINLSIHTFTPTAIQ